MNEEDKKPETDEETFSIGQWILDHSKRPVLERFKMVMLIMLIWVLCILSYALVLELLRALDNFFGITPYKS